MITPCLGSTNFIWDGCWIYEPLFFLELFHSHKKQFLIRAPNSFIDRAILHFWEAIRLIVLCCHSSFRIEVPTCINPSCIIIPLCYLIYVRILSSYKRLCYQNGHWRKSCSKNDTELKRALIKEGNMSREDSSPFSTHLK